MKEISSSITFEIQPQEVVRMPVLGHATLAGCGARIWVTRHGDPMDYWLEQGKKLALNAGDRLYLSVEGERSARVVLTVPARCEERLLRWLGSRLRAMLSGRGARLAA